MKKIVQSYNFLPIWPILSFVCKLNIRSYVDTDFHKNVQLQTLKHQTFKSNNAELTDILDKDKRRYDNSWLDDTI